MRLKIAVSAVQFRPSAPNFLSPGRHRTRGPVSAPFGVDSEMTAVPALDAGLRRNGRLAYGWKRSGAARANARARFRAWPHRFNRKPQPRRLDSAPGARPIGLFSSFPCTFSCGSFLNNEPWVSRFVHGVRIFTPSLQKRGNISAANAGFMYEKSR